MTLVNEAFVSAYAQLAVLQVDDLRIALTNQDEVVSDISFSLRAGQVTALVGESGSGKTSIAMALLGHCRKGAHITSGKVSIAGIDILAIPPQALTQVRGKLVSHVAQNPAMALNPLLRIETHLHDVLQAHQPELDLNARNSRILQTLVDAGLPGDVAFLRRFPHQLSGGQQQRVMLALAFILRPQLIVLDEPTTALDVTTQARILNTIQDLCRAYQVAAIYVSHDLAVVRQIAQQVIVLYAGRIVEVADTASLFSAPSHPYTRGLIAAIPDIAQRNTPRPIPGKSAAPGTRASGCAFSPRCAYATDLCRQATPLLNERAVPDSHAVACHHAHQIAYSALPASPVQTQAALTQPDQALDKRRPLLQVRGIFAAYSGHKVLFDVSLSIKPGECLALVGESGSGKTTLARAIAGLGSDIQGELRFKGELLPISAGKRSAHIRHQIQYIFQNPYLALNPRHTIGKTLQDAVRHFFPISRKEAAVLVISALQEVSLQADILEKYPQALSGGELQRVSIARALICKPELLVCDEITSALDVSVQATILELLQKLQSRGLAILFVTHNLGVVRAIADNVVVMKNGLIIEQNQVDALFDHPQAPYTQALIQDSPSLSAPIIVTETHPLTVNS